MDDSYKAKAAKSIQTADYLLTTSYKFLKEPKTLIIVSDHVLDALMTCVSVLLERERELRSIPPYHDNTESKSRSFRNYIADKYGLQEYATMIERIIFFSQERKKAPMEFGRNGSYVVCSDQFSKISTITEDDVKRYIKKAKEFIPLVEKVIRNE